MKRLKKITRIHIIVISSVLVLLLPLLGFPNMIETALIMIVAALILILASFQLYYDHLYGTSWARKSLTLLQTQVDKWTSREEGVE